MLFSSSSSQPYRSCQPHIDDFRECYGKSISLRFGPKSFYMLFSQRLVKLLLWTCRAERCNFLRTTAKPKLQIVAEGHTELFCRVLNTAPCTALAGRRKQKLAFRPGSYAVLIATVFEHLLESSWRVIFGVSYRLRPNVRVSHPVGECSILWQKRLEFVPPQ